jgi:hypothetical protein
MGACIFLWMKAWDRLWEGFGSSQPNRQQLVHRPAHPCYFRSRWRQPESARINSSMRYSSQVPG